MCDAPKFVETYSLTTPPYNALRNLRTAPIKGGVRRRSVICICFNTNEIVPENRPLNFLILPRNVALVLAQLFTGFPLVISDLHYRAAEVRFEAIFEECFSKFC